MKARMLLIGNAEIIRVLAGSLLKKKYKVSAVHPDYKVCEQLSDIQDLTVICGDGTKPYILEEAGARQADTVIAMTYEDADNLVICELCKKRFGVQKTVCTVENAENTSFFRRMEWILWSAPRIP